MPRPALACLAVFWLVALPGCFPLSVLDVVFLVLSLPAPDQHGRIDLTGYSIGPTDLEAFDSLVATAVPATEGRPAILGRAQWSGLKNVKQKLPLQSVAAITSRQMLFLWWHEERARYEILIRVPFPDIFRVELQRQGFGTKINFCLGKSEIAIGDQVISIDQENWFNFLEVHVVDREKTEAAFAYLEPRIMAYRGGEQEPDPCAEPQDSPAERTGFGEEVLSPSP